jgi:ABC-type uncharacterized transport system YnjBCD ATPase subunit
MHAASHVPVYCVAGAGEQQTNIYVFCCCRFADAHSDASLAIALEPSNSKGYHRRYKAKVGLKDYYVSAAGALGYVTKQVGGGQQAGVSIARRCN